MDIEQTLPLLGNLSPAQFMRRHWQKKPLVVRQAWPQAEAIITRAALFKMAAQPDVESRLVTQAVQARKPRATTTTSQWSMQSGPFAARSLPALSQTGWTLLVQGVDLHHTAVHALMQQFRFVPDARLDDVMVSFATPDGGVGPHFDSYDVFLLQTSGRRRWRISRQKDLTLEPGVPLKILQNFQPDEEFVLQAGDMLYLPPGYAHEGVAVVDTEAVGKGEGADCITCSIGFRAPAHSELAAELLQRLADFNLQGDDDGDDGDDGDGEGKPVAVISTPPKLYKDPGQSATDKPAELPAALLAFAQKAVQDALKDPLALACVMGEYLTEPKPSVWFDEVAEVAGVSPSAGWQLDSRTRMMYDAHHIFINGESYRARGADATLMRRLADQRVLNPKDLRRASPAALGLFDDWLAAGWIKPLADAP